MVAADRDRGGALIQDNCSGLVLHTPSQKKTNTRLCNLSALCFPREPLPIGSGLLHIANTRVHMQAVSNNNVFALGEIEDLCPNRHFWIVVRRVCTPHAGTCFGRLGMIHTSCQSLHGKSSPVVSQMHVEVTFGTARRWALRFASTLLE